jgi:single-strand selective monofunctional uracil DNA glycosylase
VRRMLGMVGTTGTGTDDTHPVASANARAHPLAEIALGLCGELAALSFAPPVTHVYNPLEYAWPAHEEYLRRYGTPPREIVLLGMNPGPWGMAQTGVPFGEIDAVRDWLRISKAVGRPATEHPKRPVMGLECRRSEVSGRRLWGWARSAYGRPEAFFSRFFVANYCPLAFMEASGKNRTPDRLPPAERQPLFEACDRALRETVVVLEARIVIGIGRFAEHRAQQALVDLPVRIGRITHPSPANPAANRGWERLVEQELREIGVSPPPTTV